MIDFSAIHEFPSDLFTDEQRSQGAIIVHFLVVSPHNQMPALFLFEPPRTSLMVSFNRFLTYSRCH